MRKNNIVKGIMFIILAVVVLLLQVYPVFNVSLWGIILLVFLAGICLNQLSELDFLGAGIFLATFLTVLTYVYEPWYILAGLPYISTGVLYTFLVLLGIGLNLLFKSPRRKWRRRMRRNGRNEWEQDWRKNSTHYEENNGYTESYVEAEFSSVDDATDNYGQREDTYDNSQNTSTNSERKIEDYIRADATFGSINKYITSQNFIGGKIDCSFGDVTINLGQARLSPKGANLQIDCAFGSVKVFVPKEWSVRNEMSQAMGAINDDRSGIVDYTLPQLVLTGEVAMGSIQILYV